MAKKTFHRDETERDCGWPHSESSYAPGAKVINLAIQGGGAHGAYAWGGARPAAGGRPHPGGGAVRHQLKDVIMHSIRADGVLCDLSVASKFNTDWHFLLYLRDLGRDMASQWLDAHFECIGKKSSVDLRTEFIGS